MDSFYDLYCQEVANNEKLSKRIKYLESENLSLNNRVRYLEAHLDSLISKGVDDAVKQIGIAYENTIQQLNLKINNLESLLNINSDNSGIPTSQTPISQNKRIPNSRTKSDKHIGGQKGHSKHKLEKFNDDEITQEVHHKLCSCNNCGGKVIDQGIHVSKDEFDIKVVVQKKRHHFHCYKCEKCGQLINVPVPNNLKEDNQYGKNVQALALTLVNQGYVSINRTSEIINGLSDGEICLSSGYISKLQERLAGKLKDFIKELKQEIIQKKVLHWDDTVIMINKKRACLRFYGDEHIALYTAHEKKDKEGIDKDGILSLLNKETVVVHDHNKINYNDEYEFQNAECCAHVIRDLQKVSDNLKHEWAKDMIKLLSESHKKKERIGGIDVEWLKLQYDGHIKRGWVENSRDEKAYDANNERVLLKRLEKYKDNYLMWALHEEIPFTNNEAERSLRGSKTKMKVSGQFQNVKNAENYAIIKSYLETGKRYGIDIQHLITRALEDNYYTMEEMKSHAD